MSPFVHLSLHSEFSVSDGLVKVKALAARARELGFPAVALTDRGNLFGMVKFYNACRDAGVKPIVGVDFDVQDLESSYRVIVLAMNDSGYANLLSLVSKAYTAGGDHGIVQGAWIEQAQEGLILLSGGCSGDVGQALLAHDPERAANKARRWKAVFGDRYYLEVCRSGRQDEDTYIVETVALAHREDIAVVATNEVRFIDRDDFEAHETRVCIQDGRTLNDPRRERRYSDQQYLRSSDDMLELFSDIPEAVENAFEIACRCNLTVELGTYYLPDYPVPAGVTLEDFLTQTCDKALEDYLQVLRGRTNETDEQKYRERLQYELGVINQMGFAGYFLIVMEFVTWAKEQRIPVGPGRGSGAGSLVSFCLGITDLDPIEYNLLFERLLNPERVSMPDLDIDFCMERRDEVIAHVTDLYGVNAVSQIVTFGTMAAKAVVRDVARVQGKPYGLADRLSKLIPFEVGITLTEAVDKEAELAQFIEDNDEVAEIMDMAYRLEGVVRNVGRHAGGVVIAPSALDDFVPLYTETAGAGAVSQYDKDDVERAGLVKFDFLALKTLTIMDWAVAAVNAQREHSGEAPLDLATLPLDDPATYELLRSAETTAVFQLESEGMKDLIRRLLPDNIYDIIALVALFRPGPLQSGAVDDYINRKHRKEPVSYAHPTLETVLDKTYGVMLYQEDVMKVSQVLAGFSLGQADLLRKAMGKKIPEEMAKMRSTFLEGTRENAVDDGISNAIFDQMEKFAEYAFNKAHSAAYAMVTFQTAWLKAHYPAEFMAAVLSADMQNIEKIVSLVDEAKRMGLTVRPPDVNTSEYRFTARDGEIVYGLGAVRGVGEGPVEAIASERREQPFSDLHEFCRRVDSRRANKRVLEALIRSGSMDTLVDGDLGYDETRGQLLFELKDAVHGAEQSARNRSMGMSDMFGGVDDSKPSTSAVFEPLSRRDRLEGEKETLGLYLTGHPIEDYIEEIQIMCPKRIATLRANRGTQVVAGLVVSNRTRRSRRGNGMAFAVLDDRSGRIEASVFGEVYETHRAKLTKDAVLIVEGEVQPDEYSNALKLRAESIYTIDEARRRFRGLVEIALDRARVNGDFSQRLRAALAPHVSDGCAVAIDYHNGQAAGRVMLGDEWRVAPTDDLLMSLKREFGAESVHMRYRAANGVLA